MSGAAESAWNQGRVLTPDQTAALRAAFSAHTYTVDAVVALIGEPAHRALGRNATVPGRRALSGRRDPLATLTRLWLLQDPVPRAELESALPGLVAPMLDAGLLTGDAEPVHAKHVHAEVDLRPYAADDGVDGWIAADLTPGLDTRIAPIRPDYVLGVSSASSTLAQLTLRRPVGRALDLGTGCGVQSLHLARHAEHVVATDLNPRALTLARLTAGLNGVELDLRQGNLYEPVEEERFDLIVTNPPYVMSPPGGERLAYREGNFTGDGLVEAVVRGGVERLTAGGVLQVLGNWAHIRDQDWTERVGGWLGEGLDVHVVERETLEPAAYVELWLADAGLSGAPDYRERYLAWCDYFDDLGIEAVGLGWLLARRTDAARPYRRLESWPYAVEQPLAPALAAELDAVRRDQEMTDADILSRRWRLAADVGEESFGVPGAADPTRIVLRQQRGLRRAVAVDTAQAAVLGACDGDLELGRIVDTVADLLGLDPATLRSAAVERVRALAVDGLIG